jgi:glucan 1,3-beta-glucosidase
MVAFSTVALFVTLRSLLLLAPASPVGASPVAHPLNGTHGTNSSQPATAAASSNYWLANIQRQGVVAFGAPGFQIYRNVMDFGAKGLPKQPTFGNMKLTYTTFR